MTLRTPPRPGERETPCQARVPPTRCGDGWRTDANELPVLATTQGRIQKALSNEEYSTFALARVILQAPPRSGEVRCKFVLGVHRRAFMEGFRFALTDRHSSCREVDRDVWDNFRLLARQADIALALAANERGRSGRSVDDLISRSADGSHL